MDKEQLQIGGVLLLRDANERRSPGGKDPQWYPPECKIVKVGRTRVTVEGPYGRQLTGAIDTGRITDWTWLQLPTQFAAERERAQLLKDLDGCGLQVRSGKTLSVEQLRAVLTALEGDK